MNRLFYVVNTGPKGLTHVPSFAGKKSGPAQSDRTTYSLVEPDFATHLYPNKEVQYKE